ncbi:MAG: single-stranded DNA-binding protein [Puniceicoccales bacterium]|jgi:single-strand DNA-binding protein|nr:single-stranded DNA-binding protein [Puniceicoccales bacterium]
MASFNKVILLGNLTRDPELRTTPNGTSICRFTMAVSRQFRNADGSSREEVLFIDVDSFNKQAEAISRYMAKGHRILIEGRLRLDQWESQNGERRSRIMVVAESFQFLDSPSRRDGDGYGGEGGEAAGAQRRPPRSGGRPKPRPESEEREGDEEGTDEEIPF